MQLNNNKKKWDFETIQDFDRHIEQSIACYNRLFYRTSSIIEYYINKNSTVIDIGCSTGNLLKYLSENTDDTNNFIGVDISDNMAGLFEQNCGHINNIQFLQSDALDIDYDGASVVVSMFTLQFIPLQDREKLLEKIYFGMKNGGVLIVCEKVLCDDSMIDSMYHNITQEDKRENFTPEEILNKTSSLRGVMTPLSMSDNIKLFQNSCFDVIDIFHKDMQFTGFILTKKVL